MATSTELRKAARSNLKKKWYMGMIITVLSVIIGVYSAGPIPNVAVPMEQWIKDPSVLLNWSDAFYFDMRTVRSGLYFLLGAAGVLGSCRFYTILARGGQAGIKDLFRCYPQMVPAIGLRILRSIYTFLGFSAFVIPGIYIRYTYSLAPYIMMDDPEIGVRDALMKSRRMMKGHKMRMLTLDLSFIGWFALCILSLGTGLLFLIPYHNSARANFYIDLCNEGNFSRSKNTQILSLKGARF